MAGTVSKRLLGQYSDNDLKWVCSCSIWEKNIILNISWVLTARQLEFLFCFVFLSVGNELTMFTRHYGRGLTARMVSKCKQSLWIFLRPVYENASLPIRINLDDYESLSNNSKRQSISTHLRPVKNKQTKQPWKRFTFLNETCHFISKIEHYRFRLSSITKIFYLFAARILSNEIVNA